MSEEEFHEAEKETDVSETEGDSPGIPRLTFEESRVLGCLLEKEATTPDNYPLSLNALHAACNQSSNRHPVLDLGTDVVEEAVEGLRYKNLALLVRQAGARVPKSRHTMEAEFPYMTRSQMALLCVLMLRGQQTAGELRQRTERMHPFSDLDAVEAQLEELDQQQAGPAGQAYSRRWRAEGRDLCSPPLWRRRPLRYGDGFRGDSIHTARHRPRSHRRTGE